MHNDIRDRIWVEFSSNVKTFQLTFSDFTYTVVKYDGEYEGCEGAFLRVVKDGLSHNIEEVGVVLLAL